MRVRILGVGIIGLACAEELQRRGHEVAVVDPAPGSGASWAAAGMLSPGGEAWHGEDELFRLGVASADLWPGYADRLGVALHPTGTLLAGCDAGDVQQVLRQAELLAGHGVSAEVLTGREARALEPTLGPRVGGGVHLPHEQSVDPRAVVTSLRRRLGDSMAVPDGASAGGYDATVVATGAALPAPFTHLVRPVRGEILRVRTDDPPARTVRGLVLGEPVYVVPRAARDGRAEVVIGATSEEHDEPPVATVLGVSRLLHAARELLPGLDRAEFVEAIARDRPGTADNLPLVGTSGIEGVVLAAGHYRHGVLLAPLTAELVADHLESGHVEPALDPRRFPITEEKP
jgi:glycine oxidase